MMSLVEAERIELSSSVCRTEALPLSYAPQLGGPDGDRTRYLLRAREACTRLHLRPMSNAVHGGRRSPRFRPARRNLVPAPGFEPGLSRPSTWSLCRWGRRARPIAVRFRHTRRAVPGTRRRCRSRHEVVCSAPAIEHDWYPTGDSNPEALRPRFLRPCSVASSSSRALHGRMASTGGLEPPTFGFADRRSLHLSYVDMAPREGLEPPPSLLNREVPYH